MPSSYTIDRFEGDGWVILEDKDTRTFAIPRRWVPSGAREGDVVQISEDGPNSSATMLRLELDPEARAERLRETERQRQRLPRGPKEDVSL